MKEYTRLVTGLGMVAMLAAASAVVAQPSSKTAEKSAATPAGPPEDLKVLTPYIGQWTSESVIRPNLRTKEAFTSKGDMTGQWMHNGHFIGLAGLSESQFGTFQSTAVIWYDRGRIVFTALAKNEKGEVLRDVSSTSKRNTAVERGSSSEPAKEPAKKK
jgi:hypothetical protein